MLLLIHSARKRSDCVFGVLFARSVDPLPFWFFSSSISFLNPFMLLLRVLQRCFYPMCQLDSLFVPGWFVPFNQEPLALLIGGMP